MVQFHLGKVLKVIRADKGVVASDSSVQAVVEMWDKNQLVLNVESSIAPQLRVNDVVLVDYNPIPGISPPVPKQTIIKALRGRQGRECWELFKKYFGEKTKQKKRSEEEQAIPGIPYSR